jgi:hypothetical protein
MTAGVLAPPPVSLWGRLRRFVGSPQGALLGGLLFASWAAYINRDGGLYVSVRSFLGQLLSSAALTFGDARLMDGVFRFFRRGRRGAFAAAMVSLLVTYGVMIGVHLFLHTPHIFLTLLPGAPPTVGFSLMYATLLLREHHDHKKRVQRSVEEEACIRET